MKTPKTGNEKAKLYAYLHKQKFTEDQIVEIAMAVERICNALMEESEKNIVQLLQSIKARV